jgi:indolepyruvate decarboxylase
MFGDKSVMSEDHPGYIGMYIGRLMNEPVRAFVEACDAVVLIGAMLTDGNTAGFTARLDPDKAINIDHHRATIGDMVYRNVEIADILARLSGRITRNPQRPAVSPASLGPIVSSVSDPITADALYPRWASFFRPNDVIMTDTGTSSLGGWRSPACPPERSFTTRRCGRRSDGRLRRRSAPRSALPIVD